MLKSESKSDRIISIFTVLPDLRWSNEFFLMAESLSCRPRKIHFYASDAVG